MAFNVNSQVPLMASNGDLLKQVKDFKYLGSRMTSTERDIKERKVSAWRALHNLKNIWTSNLSRVLKTWIFVAAIETILLYSCEAWTLTARLTKLLDVCYI